MKKTITTIPLISLLLFALGTLPMKSAVEYPDENPQKTVILVEKVSPNDAVFETVEKLPQFPGGEKNMEKWIKKNLKYPKEAKKMKIEGRVLVSFKVDKTGQISDVSIQKSVNELLDNEAVRLVNSMPKWEPASNNGVPINAMMTIPVNFFLKSK